MAADSYSALKPPLLAAAGMRWRGLRAGMTGLAVRALSITIFLLIWGSFSLLPWAVQVPSPVRVASAALALHPLSFGIDLALSVYRVIFGFLCATIVGVPLGIVIGYSQTLRDLLFPPIELFRPVPPIAWIPLATLFFPKVEWMVLFLTFYGAFFPIVYNTIAGVENIRATYLRAGKSLGASEWTLFWEVVLPAALPVIFTGLDVAIGVAWLMVVAGEMIANTGGIGALTWQSYQTGQYAMIFVGMASIGILGYLSSLLVKGLTRLVVRWEH